MTVLLVLAVRLSAQDAGTFEPVRKQIRDSLSDGSVPSVAVAVAKDGKILWEEGFGWADREQKQPATAHTAYNIASVTKPVTATAIMRLVQDGKIDLDAPANLYLEDFQVTPFPGDLKGPTVRELLMHRSGLPAHWQSWNLAELKLRPAFSEIARRYAFAAWPRGERYEYSNLGYGVLGEMGAHLSGRPYADFIQEEVFRPLQMRDSFVGPTSKTDGVASPYSGLKRIELNDGDTPASGAAFSSVHDLALFGIFHLGALAPGQERILTDANLQAMRNSSLETSGTERYGMGWSLNTDMLGLSIVSHSGANPGYESSLLLVPSEKIVIAVLTNSNNSLPSNLTREILMQLLPSFRARVEEILSHQAEKLQPSQSQPAAIPAPPAPEALTGKWAGKVHTYAGEIPLTLWCSKEGEVRIQLGDQLISLVNDVDFNGGSGLSGFALGDLGTPDDSRLTYDLKIDLTRNGDRMYGVLSTHERRGDRLERPSGELAYFAELAR
jgi:CubicO group peptidase (beta-lactamase class C family)